MRLSQFYRFLAHLPVEWRLGGHFGNAIRGVTQGDEHPALCPLQMAALFRYPMRWRDKPLPMYFEAGRMLGLCDPDTQLVMRSADWCGDPKGVNHEERVCRANLLFYCGNLVEREHK